MKIKMKIKSYLELKKENKQLQQQLEEIKDLYKKRLDDEDYLLANIESTCVQNNYNNTNYKSHKIIELIRDFQDLIY